MERSIDLHIHTNKSDGIFSPKEIIDYAIENKINTISITDHDTVDAYTNSIFDYALKKGISLIPGVEISTKTNKCGIHILGYNIDINNKELKKQLSLLQNVRHIYLKEVSKKLNQLGYKVKIEELEQIKIITKGHIARDIIKNIENKDILIKEFGYIPSVGEFIEGIMNEGCKGYVKKETITPKEAADLIRNAGGKVVIAHPVAYKYEDGLTEEEIEKLIKEIKADGIESYYIYINKDNLKINEIKTWNILAQKHNLITTLGSDFHKIDQIKIGLIDEDLKIEQEKIDEIIKKLYN